jgi:xanthine/uracil permease
LFEGEKTAVFWLGLVVFGYSIYQFCIAGWQIFYYGLLFPISTLSIPWYAFTLNTVIPAIIGGIIFLVIGLYIMKAGVKRINPQTKE